MLDQSTKLCNNKISEHFDEKIRRTTKTNCGIACTKVFGCKGFQTDEANNICYLSKTPILGSPTKSVFAEDYSHTAERCNKVNAAVDIHELSETNRKANAAYICTPDDVNNEQTFKIYDNTEKIIDSLNDLKYINVDEYEFVDIDWNNDIVLDDYKNLVINPDKVKYITTLTEYDDEHLGQYMFDHRCSANISQYDCMKFCIDNDECLGTEWNPTYIKKIDSPGTDDGYEYEIHKGVCCPKRVISKIIPRREEYANGHFYLKEKIRKDDKKNENTVFVKFGDK